MIVVPALMPLTEPVEEFIVPIAVLLLLHVPPDGVADNVLLLLTQTAAAPEMEVGVVLTVTTAVAAQPVASV